MIWDFKEPQWFAMKRENSRNDVPGT